MSVLFEPIQFGNLVVPNRFICSATYEAMALETGEVTDQLISRYRKLARGGNRAGYPRVFLRAPPGAGCSLSSWNPYWKKPMGTLMMKRLVGKYNLEEGYNLEAAKSIKPVLRGIPLAVVGG